MFTVDLMRCTNCESNDPLTHTHGLLRVSVNFSLIPSVNSALRIARALNDPYGSDELNLPLADRYNAGVLDMTRGNITR